MEELLLDIVAHLRELPAERSHDALTRAELDALWRKHNRGIRNNEKHLSKRYILPYYQKVKQNDPEHWQRWNIDSTLEKRLIRTIQMKPHRTGSGVATITVITRPQTCSSNCLYCPCDLRMPKSYLANEPACQRAEHNFFDPYLQVAARLRALSQMGHSIDKIELIVLGGTWSDYPRDYQLWFMRELFRALNDWPIQKEVLRTRYEWYRSLGIANTPERLSRFVEAEQRLVNQGKKSFNEAFHALYQSSKPHQSANKQMHATMEELQSEQLRNEQAAQRVVGLVIETRPDTITPENLTLYRQMGCTKIQMGIQSTRQEILDVNHRYTTMAQIRRAFNLVRLFGFKIHAHLMVNLLGSTPASDKEDFHTFVNDASFLPDEIKLYPCALVEGTQLVSRYNDGSWRPYSREELVDVLVHDVLETPDYIRISRMIRDISADDILVGNKHTNLRQMVENEIRSAGSAGLVHEIRFREIALNKVNLDELTLSDVTYDTNVSHEHFLQWITPAGRIAGFCRLSLPRWEVLTQGDADVHANELPATPGQAMIREVHVYGQSMQLGREGVAAQHKGLGRQLVERACAIAQQEGFSSINVISSVGTRAYYRRLGFKDAGLYQRRQLTNEKQ